MVGNEITWGMNSSIWAVSSLVFMETRNFSDKAFSHLAFLSSDPLFSSIVTLYVLILLYFPHLFLRIAFSPVLILTGILVISLLRIGAVQKVGFEIEENSENKESKENNSAEPEEVHKWDSENDVDFYPNQSFEDSFVEWDVRAPLEVIYEEYEGKEEHDPNPNEKPETPLASIERYPSLSLCYPESDSDTSSDGGFPATGDYWDSPESIRFQWEEEDRDGLIEIALDRKGSLDFHGEEENLIEIDISLSGNNEFTGEKLWFSGERLGSVNLD